MSWALQQIVRNHAVSETFKQSAADADRYIALLKSHDWHYEYSDDQNVWRRGRVERDVLATIQSMIDPDFSVWNQYCYPTFKRET